MLGKFFDIFGKAEESRYEIPTEVLEIANQRLPDNFVYRRDGDGNYRAFPRPEKVLDGFEIQTQFDFEKAPDLLERLKLLPRDKWDLYFYRTQKVVPIKNMQMGNADKLVPFEMLMAGPYDPFEVKISDAIMYPPEFAEPTMMVFESPEGDRAEIYIQQQAYDNLMEIKFASVNYPALSVVIYEYSPLVDHSDDKTETHEEKTVRAYYSVNATKGECVQDTLAALRIFRGLLNGTTKVDGRVIEHTAGCSKRDIERINEAVDYWEKASRLEEILEVSFKPGASFPQEDAELFTQLVSCMLEKKPILWEHPFDHFHVHDYKAIEAGKTFEDYIGKNNMRYRFLEGPVDACLLGAKFNLYSNTAMDGFVISDVDWDDHKMQTGEIYITDGPAGPWTLTRMYITEKEAMAQKAVSQ